MRCEQLEMRLNALNAQVIQQGQQITELQKRLVSMQLTSRELEAINNATLMAISNNSIEIKKVNGSTICRISSF
ncbi:hypothetical protein I4630_16550 [Proteus cibarius]|uniref:hypothetical protein n=1 Tax=Proteus terrae TaxID=1574161 RepID=UPI0018C59965|nr:hypothetical protein [Proteus terrae]MBG3092104.1 hypothetical protein [Proteus terrae subsp. cibarius]